MSDYKPPLNVFVVWRPRPDESGKDTSAAADLAEKIYSYFARDIVHPMSNGLGIPIYFRSGPAAPGTETPAPTDLTAAEHCAVIVLAESGIVTSRAAL